MEKHQLGENSVEIGYVSFCQFSNDPFQVNYQSLNINLTIPYE